MALFLAVLIFMAIAHPARLREGTEVITGGDMVAYGWLAAVGIVGQMILHEIFSLLAAKVRGVPLRIRWFPFGVNAAASLTAAPRNIWTDAVVGMAGPLGGAVVCAILALVYKFTEDPYFLGMACVGCFYNLFTLIPILELEGGWIAPAVAPQAWLIGLALSLCVLAKCFNLVLLGVVAFGFPASCCCSARAPRARTWPARPGSGWRLRCFISGWRWAWRRSVHTGLST